MKRLKLVLSLYACEPNRGSEPGVGWAWALGMAKRHDTYVLTRANNRDVIEAELARLNLPESEIPTFIYVDLSPFMCRLKKRGVLPISLYYLLWQFQTRRTLNSLHLNADIIHHVTFNSFVCPGVWWKRKEWVVLGPLGGMSICPASYLRVYGFRKRCREIIRGWSRRFWRVNVFFLLARRNADAMFFTEQVVAKKLSSQLDSSSFVMLETAIPMQLELKAYDKPVARENQLVWAGTLEPHKACELAIRAYARAFAGIDDPPILKIFGQGSDLFKCQKVAADLDVSDNIKFCGSVSQMTLWEEVRRAKAFVFTSVRDTSGNVALEALALQTPIICFNHQGVSTIADNTCAIQIAPGDWNTTIDDFAKAMCALNGQAELIEKLGAAGRVRVLAHFTWERKFDTVDVIYDSLLKQFREKC